MAARGSRTYRVMGACCHPRTSPSLRPDGGRSAVGAGVDVRVELVGPPETAVDVRTGPLRLRLLVAALVGEALRVHPGLLRIGLRAVGVGSDAKGLGLPLARRELVVAGILADLLRPPLVHPSGDLSAAGEQHRHHDDDPDPHDGENDPYDWTHG